MNIGRIAHIECFENDIDFVFRVNGIEVGIVVHIAHIYLYLIIKFFK